MRFIFQHSLHASGPHTSSIWMLGSQEQNIINNGYELFSLPTFQPMHFSAFEPFSQKTFQSMHFQPIEIFSPWTFQLVNVPACKHFSQLTFQPVNFPVFECFSQWTFQPVNISASKHSSLWKFQPVNISDFEHFSLRTFQPTFKRDHLHFLVLSNTNNFQIDLFDTKYGTLAGSTTPDQTGTGSNGNERKIYSPDLQYRSLTIRCNLMSYSGNPFGEIVYLYVLRPLQVDLGPHQG